MTDGPFKPEDFTDACYEQNQHLAAEVANARYRELHPPVSEELKFTTKDFLDEENRAAVQALEASCLFPMNLVSRLEQLGEISANNANAKLQRILAQGVRVLNTERGVYIKDDINPSGIVINIEEVTK